MNVLFDYQAFSLQRTGGVSRYFAELLRRLAHDEQVHPRLGVRFTDNEHLLASGVFSGGTLPLPLPGQARRTAMRLLNKAASVSLLRRGECALFHPTYYGTYFLPSLGATPFVLTIYDMIHELFPQEMPARESSVVEKKRHLALKARRIIALSENTRRDILSVYPIPPERVHVIHLANSLHPAASIKRPAGVPDRYLLFVGTRPGYKNFPRLLRALGPLFLREGFPGLVCAGGGPFTPEEEALIARLSLTGIVRQRAVNDAELASLYAHALAFVFPSSYEGFGMPLLEAFACGCPVAASGTSSFREVAGSAALYFDPTDEEALSRAVTSLVEDESLRRRMATLGTDRLRLFSWEATAEKTRQLYLECV